MPDALVVVLLLAFGALLCWTLLQPRRNFYAPPAPFEPRHVQRIHTAAREIDDLANAALRDMASIVSDHLQRRHHGRR